MFSSTIILLTFAINYILAYNIPNVQLYNAAQPGMIIPATGLGTGGYSSVKTSFGAYPECWSESAGCGPWVINATTTYLKMAWENGKNRPVRIDNANSYQDVASVGIAIKQSGIPRGDIFLLQKIGNGMCVYKLFMNHSILFVL